MSDRAGGRVDFDAVDISRTASAATLIYDALRKAITEGALPEGAPLRQDDLAKKFNTSRIPVREAISRLEKHGLVSTQRYKGAVVAGLSAEEAAEIFDFRALTEAEIIRQAVPELSKTDLDTAEAQCEAFAATDDPMRWADLNRDFHDTLYRPSALPFHVEMATNAMDRTERYVRAQLWLADGVQRAHAEHLAILDACRRGQSDTAADLVRAHILGAKTSLLASLTAQKTG